MRAAVIALTLVACTQADGDPKPSPRMADHAIRETPSGKTGPVVVELFTSQGCSSCPPADKLLADLAHEENVVPLSFHVDYWNDLGWDDPYSTPAWSERQRAYARSLGDRVYTPEAVIGGQRGVLGSSRGQVSDAIQETGAPALLAATGTWATAMSGSTLAVKTTAPADADVWVAIYEERVSNKVPRGENSGETLAHVHVVRKLEKIAAAGADGARTLAIDPAWKQVGAVAFAQRADRVIVASAALPH